MANGFLLLVEDRDDVADLFVRTLRTAHIDNEVVRVRDGLEALDYLCGTGEYEGRDTALMPSVVVLDMGMPRMGGLQTLRRIRAGERTELLPVVIFSSTRFPDDVNEAYRLGANSFLDKATTSPTYPELVPLIMRYWLLANEPPSLPGSRRGGSALVPEDL